MVVRKEGGEMRYMEQAEGFGVSYDKRADKVIVTMGVPSAPLKRGDYLSVSFEGKGDPEVFKALCELARVIERAKNKTFTGSPSSLPHNMKFPENEEV